MSPTPVDEQTGDGYNFAYLDEQTKRMIRRALLKALAVPGYQVPFCLARDADALWLGHRWGAGDAAACLTPDDCVKVIDQGADDTTNAVSIRSFLPRRQMVSRQQVH